MELKNESVTSRVKRWQDKGIVLKEIEPWDFGDRGIGFVATSDIEKETTVLTVPFDLAHTRSKVRNGLKAPSQLSTQCMFAIKLALNIQKKGEKSLCHVDSLPSERRNDHTLFWPSEAIDNVPWQLMAPIRELEATFDCDWKLAKVFFSKEHQNLKIKEEDFKNAWIIVNHQKFQDLSPKTKVVGGGDNICLLPLAEMFNHSFDGCDLETSDDGYRFKTSRSYKTGDEVCHNYGSLTNDILLVEYGFILPDNSAVSVDEYFMGRMDLGDNISELAENTALTGKGEWNLEASDALCGIHKSTVGPSTAKNKSQPGWLEVATKPSFKDLNDATRLAIQVDMNVRYSSFKEEYPDLELGHKWWTEVLAIIRRGM